MKRIFRKLLASPKKLLTVASVFSIVILILITLIPHTAQAECSVTSPMDCIYGGFVNLIRSICVAIMTLFSWVLGVSGIGLDLVINQTIVNMSTYINKLSAVDTAWKFFRDISNMFFIFVLTFAGVGTILGLQKTDWKVVLKNIIIAGLLINFSLFFTKIPIDISNIFSIQLYKGISGNSTIATFNSTGVAGQFMQYLKTASVYKPNTVPTTSGDDLRDLIDIIIATVLSCVIFLVTACVFCAMAGMLLMRFLLLIYVMIISPLFFLSMILPQAKNFGGKWKENLISQCIFPVVMFLLLFVAILFLRSGALNSFSAGDFASGAQNRDVQSAIIGLANLIINYVLVMAMIVGSISVAKAAGAQGTKFIDKRVGDFNTLPQRLLAKTGRQALRPAAYTGGFVGRQTAGRAINSVANSTAFNKLSAGNFNKGIGSGITGMISRNMQAKVKKVGDEATFDVRNINPGTLGAGVKGGYTKRRDETLADEKKAKLILETKESENEFDKARREAKEVEHIKQKITEAEFDNKFLALEGIFKTPNSIKGEQVAQRKETFAKLFAERTMSQLEKIDFAEVLANASSLTSARFAELVGEKSYLTGEQKTALTDARFADAAQAINASQTNNPQAKESAKESVVKVQNEKNSATYSTGTPEIKAGIDKKLADAAAKLKIITDAEEKLSGILKGFSEKEAEIITEHLFAKDNKDVNKKDLISGFINNISQERADKLKKSDLLSGAQKKEINNLRKALLQEPFDRVTKINKELSGLIASTTSNPAYATDPAIRKSIDDEIDRVKKTLDTERNKLKAKIKAASDDQIASMSPEFLVDSEVIKLLDGGAIKKILDKGNKEVKITDPKTGQVIGTENFNEYISQKMIGLAKSGEKVAGIEYILKTDIAGQFGLDVTETKKAIAVAKRVSTIDETRLTEKDRKYLLEEIAKDELFETDLTPPEITQYTSTLNVDETKKQYGTQTPTPDQLKKHYLENATGPRLRILKAKYLN